MAGVKRVCYIGFCLLFIFGMAEAGFMPGESGTCGTTVLSIERGPQNIVFISDPHLRPENIGHVREVIGKINELKPNAVLIGGDFTYGDLDDPTLQADLQAVWKEIDAPVYAILGNHDYRTGVKGSGLIGTCALALETVMRAQDFNTSFLYSEHPDFAQADAIEKLLEQNGVTVLRNESVELPGAGTPVILVGVDDVWANMANPPEIPNTGTFVIYLVHEPVYRPEWNADLVLAGHTHGGQFNTVAMKVIDYLGIADISGLSYKGSVPLYVTRGIGNAGSDEDIQFMAPPEVLVINPAASLPGCIQISVAGPSSSPDPKMRK